MAVDNTNVELTKFNVSSGVAIDCDIDVYDVSEIFIYYGHARILATLNVDYTVNLTNEDDVPPQFPTTFSFTPTGALITKINNLIISDPSEANTIAVRRTLEYTSDFTATDAFFRDKIVEEADKNIMRMQQLAFDFELITDLATARDTAVNAANTATTAAAQSRDDAAATAADRAVVETIADSFSNPVTHAQFDPVATNVTTLLGRQIVGGGLATGGGTLAADRTITVPKAAGIDVVTGTDDAKAVTALGVKSRTDSMDDNVLHVRDQRTANAAGDSWTTSFVKQTLQTTVVNGVTGASLASSQITLPAGTYEIRASTVMACSGSTGAVAGRCRLRNITAGTTIASGLPGGASVAPGVVDSFILTSSLTHRFTLAGATVLELQVRATGTSVTSVPAVNDGDPEVYADVYIKKIKI